MEIGSVWKYVLAVICIENLIVAIRPNRHKARKVLRHEDELNKGLDLQGHLQRQFFADTALADIRKNAVASPFSALLLLVALAKGATGGSLQELEAAIGFKKKEIDVHLKQVFRDMKMKNASLCIMNKMYLQKGVQLLKIYRQRMQRLSLTIPQQVDFNRNKETANLINRWVAENTNGKIPSMLSEYDVGPSDVIFLISTLNFVGHWQYPFEETVDRFNTPHGVKSVAMMKRKGVYMYAQSSNLDAEIIRIPYVGGEVHFYIVLPRERNSISQLLELVKADPEVLDDLKKTRPTAMTLIMPMFEVVAKFDLVQLFEELGIQQIFSERTVGLSEMVTSSRYQPTDLRVTGAIQKAYINVTAKGTVAGAASAEIHRQ
ncbi:serine protease inhibitor 3/4-like isoform X3 [Aricia agestis]|uniref:serine protease inhibitor 3/4-like isoform X3 n=1 Tax=Aricia agestis TaxID=91739 RepID=UPI001C202491|nr:serine protease inhibitor 3/4-like isoform X3 [Aricia agestis]